MLSDHQRRLQYESKRKLLLKKRGRKPKFRQPFTSINDLGSGLERPHPRPRKHTFTPKCDSKDQLDEILSINYNRRRCTVKIRLKNGTIVECEHFLLWDFNNAARKIINFFQQHDRYHSVVYMRMYTAAELVIKKRRDEEEVERGTNNH